jgi:anti-sigma B factor antagonist
VSDGLLAVEVQDRGTDVVVSVAGELDFGTTSQFMAVVEPLAVAGRPVVLDFSDVVFCDSSALGALVRLHNAAQGAGGALILARLRPQVERSITLTMLHRLLTIHPDIPAAPAD